MDSVVFFVGVCLTIGLREIAGACSWPAVFQDSGWRDNTRGNLVFTTTTMSGWSFTTASVTISNWECLDTASFTADGILLLKATDTFDLLGTTWTSYLCLQMTQVSIYSYYYYQRHERQVESQHRVKINNGDQLTTKAEICNTSVVVPVAEFHLIVKSGFETAAKQYCPPSLLKNMNYAYSGGDGSSACGSSTDAWDVCTDRQIMTFDYSTCSQMMAYSASGTVWCVMNITNTYEYVVTYNTDSTLSGSATRFSCFVVSTDGTTASMVNNNCTENMTPTSFPMSHDGTNIGAKLTMTASQTCPFTNASSGTNTDASSSTASAGINSTLIAVILGSLAGFMFALMAIAIIIYVIKRKKSSAITHVDTINTPDSWIISGSTLHNGHVSPLHVEEVENTPRTEHHNTSNAGEARKNPPHKLSPGRNTLDPLPSARETTTTTTNAGHTVTQKANVLPPIGRKV